MHGWDSWFSLFAESSPITLILPERLQGQMVHVLKCSCLEKSVPKWLLPECSRPKWWDPEMVQWLKRVIWHLVLEISINGNQVSGNHVSGGLPIASLDSKSQCALHREQANKGHVSIQAKSSHLTQQFIWLRSIKLQHKDRFSRNTLSKKLPSFSLEHYLWT